MRNTLARRELLRLGVAASTLAIVPDIATSNSKKAQQQSISSGGALLDYADVQVLFADLQISLVAGSRTVSSQALGRSASALAKVATILKVPMLFSVVPEANSEPVLIPELLPFATQANTLKRTLASPLMDTQTAAKLASNKRKTLIIAGFAAEVVVIQTILDAIKLGYNIQYVVDAVGGLSERTETAALRHAQLVGAIPTSVVSLTTRLTPDFFKQPGSETFKAIQPLL